MGEKKMKITWKKYDLKGVASSFLSDPVGKNKWTAEISTRQIFPTINSGWTVRIFKENNPNLAWKYNHQFKNAESAKKLAAKMLKELLLS